MNASRIVPLVGMAALLVGVAGALPLPAAGLGALVVLLGLRLAAMAAAIHEPAAGRPIAPARRARAATLRAANG